MASPALRVRGYELESHLELRNFSDLSDGREGSSFM